MNKNEDQRVKKTKRDLRQAILVLLKKKPFEKITVSEICDEAVVTRMTFYKYFEDKYDLLYDAIDNFKNMIISENPYNTKEIDTIDKAVQYCKDLINVVLKYSQENIELLKALQSNQLDDMIVNICEKSITVLLQEINKIKPFKYPLPLISTFWYGGFANIINYWLYHQKSVTKAELVNIIENILNEVSNTSFLFK